MAAEAFTAQSNFEVTKVVDDVGQCILMNAFMATEIDFEVQYWWMITFSIPITTLYA